MSNDNKKNINDELHELGINLPKPENSFAAPNAVYFSTLEANVLDAIQTESFLQSLPKQTPYQIPDNYLQHFDVSVPQQNKIQLDWLKPVAAAAAMLVLLCGVYYASVKSHSFNQTNNLASAETQQVQQADLLQQITPTEAEAFINEYTDATAISTSTSNDTDADKLIQELDTKEIEAYLKEHEIEEFL